MRIGRATIIPAIIALGITGAALSGPAIAVATAQLPAAVHVLASSSADAPQTLYHA
jgi:hypothetical protein